MKHLLGLKDVPLRSLNHLLQKAEEYAKDLRNKTSFRHKLQNRFVANLFFENSTRTRFSFEIAEKNLGAHVLNFQESTSSRQKGETIIDTLKTLEAMGVEAAVIRHGQNGLLQEAENQVRLGLINAGTGQEEHPTQALLDLLTMKQCFGQIKGVTVAIIGDVRHSRVARSNLYALRKLGAHVRFAGPPPCRPDEEDDLFYGAEWVGVDEAVREADVVMMLRVQHERHQKRLNLSTAEYHEQFGLNVQRAQTMRSHAVIMHPAPFNRDVEIASELLESPSSRIFQQMENGVPVRMAVLDAVLNGENDHGNRSDSCSSTAVPSELVLERASASN